MTLSMVIMTVPITRMTLPMATMSLSMGIMTIFKVRLTISKVNITLPMAIRVRNKNASIGRLTLPVPKILPNDQDDPSSHEDHLDRQINAFKGHNEDYPFNGQNEPSNESNDHSNDKNDRLQ